MPVFLFVMNGLDLRHPLASLSLLASLPRYLRLYIRLMRDARVPLKAKMLVVGALIYLISPVDFMPDFLFPVVGQMDDLLVLILAFRGLVRLSPPQVVAEHQAVISRV